MKLISKIMLPLLAFTLSLGLGSCASAEPKNNFEDASKLLVYDGLSETGVIGDFELVTSVVGYDYKITYEMFNYDEEAPIDDYMKVDMENAVVRVNPPSKKQVNNAEYLVGKLIASFNLNGKVEGTKRFNVKLVTLQNEIVPIEKLHEVNDKGEFVNMNKVWAFKGIVTARTGKSFYIQQGDFGFYVYNAKANMTFGYEVLVQCTVISYSGLLENSGAALVAISSKTPADKIVPLQIDEAAFKAHSVTRDLPRLMTATLTLVSSKLGSGTASTASSMSVQCKIGNTAINCGTDKYTDPKAFNEFAVFFKDLGKGGTFTITAPLTPYGTNKQFALVEGAVLKAVA